MITRINCIKSLNADKGIAGEDNRVEIHNAGNFAAKSQKAAAIVHKRNLDLDNKLITNYKNFTEISRNEPLWQHERFYGQPMVAHSTAIAVDSKQLLSVAHGIQPDEIDDYMVVYGFWETGNSVYHFQDAYELESKKQFWIEDLALYKVKETIDSRWVETPFRSTNFDKMYTAGYPGPVNLNSDTYRGIPLKVCTVGHFVKNWSAHHILANIDVYPGCSGSPVFNYDHQLVGIIVSSVATHFIPHPNLQNQWVSCYYDEKDFPGVKIAMLNSIFQYINHE